MSHCLPAAASQRKKIVAYSFGWAWQANAHDARVTVPVVDGDGKVTAYRSVIDLVTQDPTYVPAQH